MLRSAVPFSIYMEQALYGPQGFYATGQGPGRRRDFLTSPEVGPLFGAVIARALDTWWEELGRPDPFIVVEHGSGPGTLAVAVTRAAPACLRAGALRLLLVERSPVLRAEAERRRPHSAAWDVREPAAVGERPAHVVMANEPLDNLPFDLYERTATGWAEVRVADDGVTVGEMLVPSPSPAIALVVGEETAPGGRVPHQRAAGDWLRAALATTAATGGRVVAIDYAVEQTLALAARPWTTWVRSYRGHARSASVYSASGTQDITVEVCVDQLAAVRPPTCVRTQAEFLRDHGIEALVEEGRRVWAERASIGDLAAIEGRSRASEAAALTDPDGLGAFLVMEWTVERGTALERPR